VSLITRLSSSRLSIQSSIYVVKKGKVGGNITGKEVVFISIESVEGKM
jgi:hypothetical protein